MTTQKQKENIYSKMDAFKKSSSGGTRQYLMSAATLHTLEERMSEDDLTSEDLIEIDKEVDMILERMGISIPYSAKKCGE